MSYVQYNAAEPENRDFHVIGFEASLPKHYQKDNIHFIINRYHGLEADKVTTDRYLSVTFGNISERDTVQKQGEAANGLRHFSEHIIGRLVKKFYAGNTDSSTLLSCFKWLHKHGIYLNAETTLHSMKVIANIPYNEDFNRCIALASHLVSGTVAQNSADIAEAMTQEGKRIENEILISKAKSHINEVITRHVYTSDSFQNSPTIIGQAENINTVTPDTISAMIADFTTNAPVVISIHNPPANVTDEEIIRAITKANTDERISLTAESAKQKNMYQYQHGWVHIEDQYIPNDGKIEATVAIPLPELTKKETATWLLLSDMLVTGGTSPKVEYLHYKSRSKLYATTVRLDRSTSTLEIDANVEADRLLDFLRDALEFFTLPEHREMLLETDNETSASIFEIFKNRRINNAMNTHQDIEELTKHLLYNGEYVAPWELIQQFQEITQEDVIALLDKIQLNLCNANMVTVTGCAQAEVNNAIFAQLLEIDDLIPIAKIVRSTAENEEAHLRAEIFS